jgi:hypothetical protein
MKMGKRKRKYFIKVEQVNTGDTWEEQLTSMNVTEDSPHYTTHETGMHNIVPDLTEDQLKHYAEGIITYFNNTLRPGESPRKLLSYRIEE